MEIKGKTAVVTGAGGGGCGRAIARRLARAGAAVVVSDIDVPGGSETVRQIESEGDRAAFFRADVAVESDIRSLMAFTDQTFGGPDILVNNAGPFFPEPLARWTETIQANLLGPMWATLQAIEAMRRRGGGAIVNFGSTSAVGHGHKHSPSPAYDTAKAGVLRLTTTLAWLREQAGIRVNCFVPSWVATAEVRSYVDALTPTQRQVRGVPVTLLSLEEVADAVCRLAADDSLAGRVLIWWNGQPPRLLPVGDPGYAALE